MTLLVFSSIYTLAQQVGTAQTTQPSGSSQTPTANQPPPATNPQAQTGNPQPTKQTGSEANRSVPLGQQQPKRILGIMPNYRAVSAGALPSPPTPKEAFKIATQNSFDYSAFIFVGITSLIAEADNSHPQLGKGIGGYGQYYWRGFVDKTDGNYWVIFVLPTFLHQDERYYALGKASILKRGIYAASRVLITPNYQGKNVFNASDVFGKAIAQGISLSYYPSSDRTFGDFAANTGTRLAATRLRMSFASSGRILRHTCYTAIRNSDLG